MLGALINFSIKSGMEEVNPAKAFEDITVSFPEVTQHEDVAVEDEEFYSRMLHYHKMSGPYDEDDSSEDNYLGRTERSSPKNKKNKDDEDKAPKEKKEDRKRGLRGDKEHKTVSKPVMPRGSRRLRASGNEAYEFNQETATVAERTSYAMMEELKKITTRFYIYDDPIISQTELVEELRGKGEAAFPKPLTPIDHVRTDADGEKVILGVLQRHPLRTMDPDEAEIFVVPTPVSELLAYGCQWENCTWYDEAFTALSKQPTFKREQGHKHVIIALSWPLFSQRWSAFVPAISRNYRTLRNVTVAHNYDPFGCLELRDMKKNSTTNDFKKIYDKEIPVTNAVSLGLGFNDAFPAVKPTYNKFKTSKHFIFYHSRKNAMAYGSTPYRFAPLDKKVVDALPPSSIGFDVSKDEWAADFTSSKFCLVIRSDTPHSHSLLYAVRAGCIPVIVSDDYSLYAPTFKSSIALEDFSVFIEEEKFHENPLRELLKLQELPDDLIHTKLESLYVAQNLIVPSHPRSLFVPALLKEVVEAEKHVFPERPNVHVNEDYTILSGWEYLYRYPSSLKDTSLTSNENGTNVIVGVISKYHHFNARHAIRNTWASERPHRVFFIVAGPWEDIEEEFLEYGDLLWINMVEDDSLTSNKVQLLFHAIDAHVDSYDYVMKTTDDTYVWLDDVEKNLVRSKPEYWGTCQTDNKLVHSDLSSRTQGLQYAHGMGYVLSRDFNECATSYIESIGMMSTQEEIATGELAELCGVTCHEEGWDWWKDPTGNKLDFITSEMKGAAPMIFKHWWVLWKRGGWDP
jgi:hypothetical protein